MSEHQKQSFIPKNKKHLLIEAALAVSLVAALILGAPYYIHSDPKVSANVYISETTGGVTSELYSGNLITDIGENFIGNATIGLQNNATWAISVCNAGTPAASWTQLDTEVAANGFTRADAAETAPYANSGDWAINFTYTFTATGEQQLQNAGLQWDSTASSNNNLFAAAAFTQTTFNSGDTLTITWVVTYNAN